MATHLRGWAYQAGAFLVLIGAFIFLAPTPAMAEDPTVRITNPPSANLKAGERVRLNFEVKNNSAFAQQFDVTVTSTLGELLDCNGNCRFTTQEFAPQQSAAFEVELVAGPMEAGRSRNGRVEVEARNGRDRGNSGIDVSVRGDERPLQVDEVNGRIRDQDGDPVAGAEVAMQDSQGHQYSTTSSSSGRYKFESSDSNPISPGSITVGAQKNGFTRQVRTTTAEAGRSVTVSLTMQSTARPTPSATPSATPQASPTPAEEPSEDAAEQPSTPAVRNTAAQDDNSGSLLFIILGGLLVAAGIGAIILVLMRRKDPDEDPDDVDGGLPAGGVVPPSHGRYGGVPDATRVAGALSGRPADATMVAGPAVPPSIADAPTMLQRAVPADDEFADPYGAPSAMPHAGYAPAAPGGWGTAAGAGAAAGAYGAAGATAGAYGTQQYGAAPAPATTYGPPPGTAAPYGGGTGTYGAAAVPATPPGQGETGYAGPPAPAGGYGGPAGDDPYARPPAPAGGYGRPVGDQRFDEPTGWYNQDAADAGHRGTPPVPGQPGYHAPDPGSGTFRPEPGTSRPEPGTFRAEPGSGTGSFRPHAPGGHAQVPSQPREPGYGQGAAYPPAPGRGPQDELGQHGSPAAGEYQPGGGYPPAPGGGGYGPDQSGQDTGYGAWSPPGEGANQYGVPAGGYGRGGGYGTPAGGHGTPAGGHGTPAGGHGTPAGGHGTPAGGHGAPAGGHGYDEATSYDARGTYGGPDGHGQAPGQPQSGRGAQQPGDQRPQPGYGDAAGGYYGDDQGTPQGGRHGGQPTQPPESTHPGQRRPLDWLDD